MRNMFDEVVKNNIRTFFLIGFFFVLILVIGYVLGLVLGSSFTGLLIAGVVSFVYFLISYTKGDKMILSMSGAKEVKQSEYPHLFHTIEGIAVAAGLPKPKAYVINDTALNAFATGRNPQNASITVTTGLLKKLNRQELEGVIAHEMGHIKNYDIRVMMLTALLIGIVILLSDFLLRSFWFSGHGNRREGSHPIIIVFAILLAILAPIIAQLIKLSISRKREYMADATGAILTRYPEGLASALEKIKSDPDPLVDKANKATAHLFISTPFRKKKSFWTGMFATHPPIDDRIKRLREM